MRWTQKLSNNIRKGIRSWLQITPPEPYAIQIQEIMDFELTAIRNRIWYRGDGNELEQMYKQSPEPADRYKFWACKCSEGMEMRKIHTGLPKLMVKVLSGIVLNDMNEFEFKSEQQKAVWDEIDKDNKFRKKLKKALKDTLSIGDGAFKVSYDTDISAFPILEWYPGDRIEIIYYRDRVKEVIFKTKYVDGYQPYVLHEHYGYGYIKSRLYRDETEVPMDTIRATADIQSVEFDKNIILAIPLKVYESSKFEGRGGSIFDGKLDSFDALDEAWSQWMDALRSGRAKTYIPDCFVPRNPDTGQIVKPNPFDNRYFAAEGDQREGQEGKIQHDQPTIPHESYIASFSNALDLCLQGVMSPSTLGIDMKKLDNADAQREKEKATLYTRDDIVECLQETIPEIISAVLNAHYIMHNQPIQDVKVEVQFGEYANPSFESQVETVSKGKQGGIMSIEASVEELYGDTKDKAWKAEEVARLKNEQGIATVTEPGINTDITMAAGGFEVSLQEGSQNVSKSNEPNIPNEQKRVPGASEDSK